jgi:hypothetical protein
LKIKYFEISILLSIISIAATLFINHQIAEVYLKAHGKTRALFGITELRFGYQYYVATLGIAALIFAILGFKGNNSRSKKFVSALLSLTAIVMVFVKIWRLFI